MTEKRFLILIIAALIIINIFSLIRFLNLKQLKNIIEANGIHQQTITTDELHTYRHNFKVNILNSNLVIENLDIKDSLNITFPIKKIFDDKQESILVYRFSQMHCESCVNSSIQITQNWVDSVGINNVVFLGNHRNNRVFNKTIPLYGIQGLKVYNCPKINIPAEDIEYPYFFVLDSNLQISNLFVPDKATPFITNSYLKNVSKKLKNKHIRK